MSLQVERDRPVAEDETEVAEEMVRAAAASYWEEGMEMGKSDFADKERPFTSVFRPMLRAALASLWANRQISTRR